MKPLDDLRNRFDSVPVNRHLGLRLLARDPEGATVAMDIAEDHIQETGLVHGGLISALADTAAVYALFPELDASRSMTSIEFKVNFLRPALPGRGPVTARSRVVQRGRRIGVCDVEVRQEEALVAKGIFTYLVMTQDEG